MPKPDYAALFAQYEIETDPVIRAQIWEQVYDFSPPVPLPEGETIEDYLLTPHEKELFAYCYDDYVENNPGYIEGFDGSTGLYVLPDYVLDGYINIEDVDVGLYVLTGYVDELYVKTSPENTGFIAYVGEYYNNNGETT